MKLGFVGTGALTAAIVTGLKSVADSSISIVVSPRNEEISADLAARYPEVRVAPDNQAVLDACDTVILAVRPQIADEVLRELRFRPDHRVISLIATVSLEDIRLLVAPAKRVTKALPMPMAAYREGATIVYPPDPDAAALFGKLGKVVEIEDAEEFDALSVVTATFATFFTLLDTVHVWLKGQGVADEKGRDYTAAIFKALAGAPEKTPEIGFAELAKEYATRGGINEQVLRELKAAGVFDVLAQSLEGVHRRIVGA